MKSLKTERVLLLGGREIKYTQERKKVKNINLRIHPDGTIHLSAGKNVPQSVIDAFLISRTAKILNALDRFAANGANRVLPEEYTVGMVLRIFGMEAVLRVVCGKPEAIVLGDGCLTVTIPDTGNSARLKTVIERHLNEQLAQKVEAYCRSIQQRMSPRGVTYPVIRYRSMKTRWGSCQPERKVITFNTRLAAYPPECIEYVVIHEFVHFLHPDHSRAFYATLESYLPDWRQRKAMLG